MTSLLRWWRHKMQKIQNCWFSFFELSFHFYDPKCLSYLISNPPKAFQGKKTFSRKFPQKSIFGPQIWSKFGSFWSNFRPSDCIFSKTVGRINMKFSGQIQGTTRYFRTAGFLKIHNWLKVIAQNHKKSKFWLFWSVKYTLEHVNPRNTTLT